MCVTNKITPVLMVMFFLLTSVLTSWLQWNKEEQFNREHTFESLVEEIDTILNDAQILAALVSININDSCSDDLLRTLSHLTASDDLICSINITRNGEWCCSLLQSNESLDMIARGTTKRFLMIESIHWQNTDMFMIYFSFDEQVIAVPIYKDEIEKILMDFSREEKIDVHFLLQPNPFSFIQVASQNYPFWVTVTLCEGLVDYAG